MNLAEFKKKYSKEIEMGVVSIETVTTITADRFDGENFLISKEELNRIQADIRKMGFEKTMFGIGKYAKNT